MNEKMPKKRAQKRYTPTAARVENPASKSRKCKCALSAKKIFLPARARRKIVHTKSISGKATIKSVVAIFAPDIIAKTANIKPINKLPPSPRNKRAGCQFHTKNPASEPKKIALKIATSGCAKRLSVENKKIIIAPIVPSPVVKPSNPSSNLVVYIKAKSHTSVKISASGEKKYGIP